MSEQLSFKNIKPLEKFNKATATREELIAYIEKLEGQLETLNDALLAVIAQTHLSTAPHSVAICMNLLKREEK